MAGAKKKASTGAKALKGSATARRHLAVLLEALSGLRGTTEAAEAMGVSLSRYYQLETRALQGMLSALEPRPRGPRKTKEAEIRALRAEKREVERELRRATSLLRAATRSVGVKPAKKGAKKKRARRGKARGATVLETIRKEAADGPQEHGGAVASPDPGE